MQVSEHSSYKIARELAKIIWIICSRWDKTAFNMVGSQLVRASDSISANLSEGWNRYSKKDKVHFFIIARGSVSETQDWIEKAFERNLITQAEMNQLNNLLRDLPRHINGLIKGTRTNLKN